MKRVPFGNRGQEKPGIVTADGRIRDVSAHVRDHDHSFFSGGGPESLRAIAASRLWHKSAAAGCGDRRPAKTSAF